MHSFGQPPLIYLSSISSVHGEVERSILHDLDEPIPDSFASSDHGLRQYRESNRDICDLALEAAASTMHRANVHPDLIVYVTEHDPDATTSLKYILQHLNLNQVKGYSLSGHDCGNVGPIFQTASHALDTGLMGYILVIVADRALPGKRLMKSELSLFSDGAAAFMLSNVFIAGSTFLVRATAFEVQVPTSQATQSDIMRGIGAMAQRCIKEIERQTGYSAMELYDHVLFPNYRIPSQRFFCSLLGLPTSRLLIGPISAYAHSFSADIFTNLQLAREDRQLKAGARILVSVSGPNSWSLIDVECI